MGRYKQSRKRYEDFIGWWGNQVLRPRRAILEEFEVIESADKTRRALRQYEVTKSGTVKGGVAVGDPPKVKRDQHFNLHDITEEDFFRERKELIRWTKQLYNKDARIVKLDEEEAADNRNFNRHFCLEEADILRMQEQTADQIFE